MKNAAGRKKNIVSVIVLFSIFSVLLLGTAWYASSLAPNMMVRNYRTVKYAAEMQSALTAIYLDAANGKEPEAAEIARFEENLSKQKQNITETGEPELTAALDQQWSLFIRKPVTPTLESFKRLGSTLEQLMILNEGAMYGYEQKALSIGKGVLTGGIMGFALVVLYAIQIVLQQDDE